MKNTYRFPVISALLALTLLAVSSAQSAPSASIYGESAKDRRTFDVYLSFSDSVTGLTASDFSITNGTAGSVTGGGKYFIATLSAQAPGQVSVTLPANRVTAVSGTREPNLASNTFTVNAQFDPTLTIWGIDSDADWRGTGSSSTGFTIANGEIRPTGTSATYTSATRTFTAKMKAQDLVLRQSSMWDNWTAVPNVGPAGAGDAPILLSVANDDYYFFGNSSADNLYHAWHSTDMVNWTQHRAIAENLPYSGTIHFKPGRWVTSAEYKDGRFYIIGDVPNDEDPSLWVDDNLKDNVPATFYSTVFRDPSHGSDASLFRSDEDGRFHIIYEDWDPINASTHAWDSPLAGHTSSLDCINGFVPHMHTPPVDERTTPTGTFGTYTHPGNIGAVSYEIHTPDQNAYGDWTSIKIGKQMYLFGDMDAVGDATMHTARFTSSSIYKQYQYVGRTGSGHPDPTVGFAEGRFYLITQQTTDQISPGPWVESVQASVGIDTSGDGTMDYWTAWQAVKESYNHKPGYARVVDVAPARLDLSAAPAGYAFTFAFRVTDSTANASTPIMDNVEMSFKAGNPVSISAGGNRKSPFYLDPVRGNHRLHYTMEQAGMARFFVYDSRGEVVKEMQEFHPRKGNYVLNLKDAGSHSMKIVEYRSPRGLRARLVLGK